MSSRQRKRKTGGGGARNPNSLVNLEQHRRNARAAPEGNGRGVKHGAYAEIAAERIDEKTRRYLEAHMQDVPFRNQDGSVPAEHAVALRDLSEIDCRLKDIGAYLLRCGWEGEDGKPRPVLDYEAKLWSHRLELLRELGMTPRAHAQIVKLGYEVKRSERSLEQAAASEDLWARPASNLRPRARDVGVGGRHADEDVRCVDLDGCLDTG